MPTFYNNNHKRDDKGRITVRDYSTYEATECSNCKKPIKGVPAFSKHGKPDMVLGVDFGNVDYCEECVSRFKRAMQ